MNLQKYFIEFDKAIKMDYDVKSELKEKRDVLLNILKESDEIPAFEKYDQGSYSMYLGIEPLDKEYDIDVGLRFYANRSEYEPMDLKNKIYDLLKNHTDYGSKIKKPCVTVTYKKDGEAAYHVDLVVYTYENKEDVDSQLYLARGKSNESDETCWEKSDPVGLVEYVKDKYKGEDYKKDREQFRRVVRFMKRWKNKKFSSSGNAEPPSIGITLIAVDKFESSKQYDYLEEKDLYDDLEATLNFAKTIKNLFIYKGISENGRALYSIEYDLPSSLNFEPNTNVFAKMSDNYMTDFKEKIDALVSDLEEVRKETDEIEQCKMLRRIFGDDFPVPEKKDAAKQQMNYIPTTSSSGVV
ncbi:MAG: nucleotidyltransferase [Lachnospira sp.]